MDQEGVQDQAGSISQLNRWERIETERQNALRELSKRISQLNRWERIET